MRRLLGEFLLQNLLLLLVLALLGCATTQYTNRSTEFAASSPAATIAQDQSDAINRPTSKPYTGELSIFEDPKRDEKLQPNRIMDILGIKEGSNVADIGAGSGWFTVWPHEEWDRAALFTRWTSIVIIWTTSRSDLSERALQTFASSSAKRTTRSCRKKASMQCYC